MDQPSNQDSSGESTTLIKRASSTEAQPPMLLRLGTASDAASGGAFSFSVVLHALRQRLLLGLSLGILVATAGCAALWHFTEPQFRSTATLKISNSAPHLVFPGGQGGETFSFTQVELLRGRYLIGRAIEAHKLQELPEIKSLEGTADAVQWIKSKIKVGPIGRSDLYDISFSTRIPTSAERVVRAVIETFMDYHQTSSDKHRATMLELLAEERKKQELKIAGGRSRLREVMRGTNGEDRMVFNLSGDEDNPISIGEASVLSHLQKKLVESEFESTLMNIRLRATRNLASKHADMPISEARIEAALAAHPEIAKHQNAMDSAEKMMAAVTAGEKFKHHAGAKKDFDFAKKKLEENREKFLPLVEQDIRQQIELDRSESIMQAELQLQSQQEGVKLIREMILQEREQRMKMADKSLDIEFMKEELQGAEEVNRRLGDRMLEMTTESNAPSQVWVVDKAKVPEFPEGPSLMKKLLMVGGAGLLMPLALLVGWDVSFRRVFEREQLLQEVNVKLVSEVATLPTRPLMSRRGADKVFRQQALLFEESVNALRTSLSVDPKLEGHRVYVVASAVSGEGKTNLSSQLAMSWSQTAPGRVILIDADVRSPNVHELFEVEPKPGLAEVLRGECKLEDAVVMDWSGRLFILPAGDAKSRSPSQLFANANFRELVATLRSHYYKVIIDVAPVLCASETLQIAKEADGVLLCALRDYSRGGQVKEAHDRLNGAGVNIVGAVLNGTPVRQYSYAYRGYELT